MRPMIFEDHDPAEAEAARILEALFAQLDAAETRADAFTLLPGSVLEGDDRATAYDPISFQVGFLLGAAFDHVGMLRRGLEDYGMPTVAAYPLVRAAVEAAAQVLWLTTGGTRKKRVFRALHRVWDGAASSDEALRRLAPQRPSSLGGLRRRLDELLNAAKASQRSLDRDHASMTDIVIDAKRWVSPRELEPIDVWRLCSSMAHGNRRVARTLLERRLDGPTTDTGGMFLVTTSYRTITAFVGVLVDLLDAALDAQDRLNVKAG